MANRFFQNALQESNELFHQFAHGAGGELWPLVPHKVQMQVEGPSDNDRKNEMNRTIEMNGTIKMKSEMNRTIELNGGDHQ